MGRSLAKGVVNPTGGVGRDPKGSWHINLVTQGSGQQRNRSLLASDRAGGRATMGSRLRMFAAYDLL
jgi:hypothetical protein